MGKRKCSETTLGNVIKQFLQGGDDLLKIERVETCYTVWQALKPHFRSFCKRNHYTGKTMLPVEYCKGSGFKKLERVDCCRICTRFTNAPQYNVKPECQCKGKRKRIQRGVFLFMKISYKHSCNDPWIILQAEHPVETREDIKEEAEDQAISEHKHENITSALVECKNSSTFFNCEPSDIFATCDDIWQMLDKKYNLVIQTQEFSKTERVIDEMLKRYPMKQVLILTNFENQSYFRTLFSHTNYIHVHGYFNAITHAYRYEQQYLNSQDINRILENYTPAEMVTTYKKFDVIIVMELITLQIIPLFYRVVKRFSDANTDSQLILFDSKKNNAFSFIVHTFWSMRNMWYDLSSKSVTAVINYTKIDPLILSYMFVNEITIVEPYMTIESDDDDKIACLIGNTIPLSYHHRSNYISFFKTVGFKQQFWNNEFARYKKQFQDICMRVPVKISPQELAFLFLCYNVELNPGTIQQLRSLSDKDWLSTPQSLAFPLFAKIGLHSQERHVSKHGIHGKMDGLTKDDEVIELKYCKSLLLRHKLQVLLYHCLFNCKDVCYLLNYRTGEMLKLSCQDKEFILGQLLHFRHFNETHQRNIEAQRKVL